MAGHLTSCLLSPVGGKNKVVGRRRSPTGRTRNLLVLTSATSAMISSGFASGGRGRRSRPERRRGRRRGRRLDNPWRGATSAMHCLAKLADDDDQGHYQQRRYRGPSLRPARTAPVDHTSCHHSCHGQRLTYRPTIRLSRALAVVAVVAVLDDLSDRPHLSGHDRDHPRVPARRPVLRPARALPAGERTVVKTR